MTRATLAANALALLLAPPATRAPAEPAPAAAPVPAANAVQPVPVVTHIAKEVAH